MGFNIFNPPPPSGRIKSFYTSAAGTFLIKTGEGTLIRLIIGKKGSGASLLTLYDNISASGTIIAVVDLVNILSSVEFGIQFTIGLSINMSSTVGDLTI